MLNLKQITEISFLVFFWFQWTKSGSLCIYTYMSFVSNEAKPKQPEWKSASNLCSLWERSPGWQILKDGCALVNYDLIFGCNFLVDAYSTCDPSFVDKSSDSVDSWETLDSTSFTTIFASCLFCLGRWVALLCTFCAVSVSVDFFRNWL